MGFWDDVGEFAGGAVDVVVDTAEALGGAAVDIVETAAGWVSEGVSYSYGFATNTVPTFVEEVVDHTGQVWGRIPDGVGGWMDGWVDAVETVAAPVVDTFIDPVLETAASTVDWGLQQVDTYVFDPVEVLSFGVIAPNYEDGNLSMSAGIPDILHTGMTIGVDGVGAETSTLAGGAGVSIDENGVGVDAHVGSQYSPLPYLAGHVDITPEGNVVVGGEVQATIPTPFGGVGIDAAGEGSVGLDGVSVDGEVDAQTPDLDELEDLLPSTDDLEAVIGDPDQVLDDLVPDALEDPMGALEDALPDASDDPMDALADMLPDSSDDLMEDMKDWLPEAYDDPMEDMKDMLPDASDFEHPLDLLPPVDFANQGAGTMGPATSGPSTAGFGDPMSGASTGGLGVESGALTGAQQDMLPDMADVADYMPDPTDDLSDYLPDQGDLADFLPGADDLQRLQPKLPDLPNADLTDLEPLLPSTGDVADLLPPIVDLDELPAQFGSDIPSVDQVSDMVEQATSGDLSDVLSVAGDDAPIGVAQVVEAVQSGQVDEFVGDILSAEVNEAAADDMWDDLPGA